LLVEEYHGGQRGEIDALQGFWQRSLRLALPELPEATLHDVLLASREALLNALQHGCGGRADQTASFQISFSPRPQTLRVRLADPGPGHDFDPARQEHGKTEHLADAHRGLLLIRNLADQVMLTRRGACLTMDFSWP
jgi:anti-sigma regulatory factor (Ser/Thr protein kinase)